MITLTAEIICDTCKRVIASGSPTALSPDLPLAEAAIEDALIKAFDLGAHIGISTATCRDCLNCLEQSAPELTTEQLARLRNKLKEVFSHD